MNLFLLRHGACEKTEDAPGGEDSQRRLTAEGRAAIEHSLPGIAGLLGQVDYILTSPYVRAVETAKIVGDYFKCTRFVETLEALAGPEGEKPLESMLNKLIGKENIVVVGHMPYLGDIAAYFAGDSLEESVDLKKGGMAKLYIKGFPGPGEARLHWVMTSEELAKSGGSGQA